MAADQKLSYHQQRIGQQNNLPAQTGARRQHTQLWYPCGPDGGDAPALIERANEIMAGLEESREQHKDGHAGLDSAVKNISTGKMQLSIFDAHSVTFEEIRQLLEAVDINRLTPVEALLKLQEIKERVK